MVYQDELNYLEIASAIAHHGTYKEDRTGVGTLSDFGHTLKFNLFNRRYPIVSTRKVNPLAPIIEMLWFLKGDTDIAFLKEHKLSIWDAWVKEDTKRFDDQGNLIGGSIGSGAYGAQWRRWEDTRIVSLTDWNNKYKDCGYQFVTHLNDSQYPQGSQHCVITRQIDQVQQAIDQIKNNPYSRRILVSGWNPGRIVDQQLPPCHTLHQYVIQDMTVYELMDMLRFISFTGIGIHPEQWDGVRADSKDLNSLFSIRGAFTSDTKLMTLVEKIVDKYQLPFRQLNLMLYQRSSDFLVGGVFNIAQYGALAHMVAHVTNTWAGELTWTIADTHIYQDQLELFEEQFKREPIHADQKPLLKINPKIQSIDDFQPSDFEVLHYQSHPFIKYPVAV